MFTSHPFRALGPALIAILLLLAVACAPAEPQPLTVLPTATPQTVQPVADTAGISSASSTTTDDAITATATPAEEVTVTQPTNTPQPEPTDATTATPLPIPTATPTPDTTTRDLYRFDSAETAGRWAIVNDSVMGGISQSTLALSEEGHVIFFGNLSLENNGGFASARSAVTEYGLVDETGMRLTARGDGRSYKLQIYTLDEPRVTYEASFTPTTGTWQTIDLPFDQFEPTIRGRVLSDVAPIDPARIAGVGMTIRDYQNGPFQLELASIEAYR